MLRRLLICATREAEKSELADTMPGSMKPRLPTDGHNDGHEIAHGLVPHAIDKIIMPAWRHLIENSHAAAGMV